MSAEAPSGSAWLSCWLETIAIILSRSGATSEEQARAEPGLVDRSQCSPTKPVSPWLAGQSKETSLRGACADIAHLVAAEVTGAEPIEPRPLGGFRRPRFDV